MTANEDIRQEIRALVDIIHECRNELVSLSVKSSQTEKNVQTLVAQMEKVEERMAGAEMRLEKLAGIPSRVNNIEDRQHELDIWRAKVAVYATIGAMVGGTLTSVITGIGLKLLEAGLK